MKLGENKDTETFLTTFKRAAEARGVDGVKKDKLAAILVPQLMGKAWLVYAAMSDEDVKNYNRVKAAIFCCYDINKE